MMKKLSICIPTYCRARHLDKLLLFFQNEVKFPFDYELVISDNASTDSTETVVHKYINQGLPIHYHKNKENIGIEKNSINAHRLAKGEYLFYLADDDLLIPDEIVTIINFLDKQPDIACCYAPWQIWDESENKEASRTYHFDHPIVVNRNNWPLLLESMLNRNLMLEVGIFRANIFHTILFQPSFCFMPDVLAAHLLQHGNLVLSNKPYYRYIINSDTQRDRPNGGSISAKYGWDERVGGAEYFYYYATKISNLQLDNNKRETLSFIFDIFRTQRMLTSLGIMAKSGEHYERHYLYCRAHASLSLLRHHNRTSIKQPITDDPIINKQSYEYIDNFIKRLSNELETYKPDPHITALQGICRLLTQYNVELVYYIACNGLGQLENNLRIVGLPTSVKVLPIDLDTIEDTSSLGNHYIITATNDQRINLLAKGMPALQVISLKDTIVHFNPMHD